MIAWWYRFHRYLGIVVLVPVLCWSLSGLTHPLMAIVRTPEIARNSLPAPKFEPAPDWQPLRQVLDQARITEFNNARLVSWKGNPHYQVQTAAESDPLGGGTLRYFDVRTGTEIPDGDRKYAEHLARSFLEAPDLKLLDLEKITTFTSNYVLINRLLPVYRLRFDRADGIEVYVETSSDRLATVNDTYRQVNLWIFHHGHTFAFLGARESWLRLTIVIAFAALSFCVGLSGLLLFGLLFRKLQAARGNGNPLRKWHRRGGLIVSLSLFGFAGTGAWMASADFWPEQLERKCERPVNRTAELTRDVLPLFQESPAVENFQLARINDRLYYQLLGANWRKEPAIRYLEVESGDLLPNGDAIYARQLASKLTGWAAEEIKETSVVTSFSQKYPPVFKRLPVVKVEFSGSGLRVCHVETTSGHLSHSVTTSSLVRTIAFLQLHKYHFLDSFGPAARDAVMSFFSVSIAGVAGLGLTLFLRR